MIVEYQNISLKDRNTFGIDVSCSRFLEFSDADDLREFFAGNGFADGRWGVISGGSNIIFTGDFEGALLHPVNDCVNVLSDDGETVTVRVGAGKDWDGFVQWTISQGLWGVENLSGVPGLVGASPVQNIGAYGVEAKDSISSVETFAVKSGKEVTMAADHCDFGYRDSIFKRSLRGEAIITAVNFTLSRSPKPVTGYGDIFDRITALGGATLENIRRAVIEIRDMKLPDPRVNGNAGSFFKNPVVPQQATLELKGRYPDMPIYPAQQAGYSKLAAGWLIDKCGWKGRRHGRVGVHERQALVLINLGGATGDEVMELARLIQVDVKDKFGVEIDTEVNVL